MCSLFNTHPLISYISVLHPAYKIQWMQEQGWEAHYVAQAKDIVRTVFEDGYSDLGQIIETFNPFATAQDAFDLDFYGEDTNMFGELDRYLGEARQGKRVDVLEFWKTREDLPGLQQMARHTLCVPGTSAEAEQVFLAVKEVIGDKQA